ncbi:MAG: 6-bladed beta-propeller [Tannerellaceae bacterium]|nr:6-bladed beta-propeller [Tannerellaceae bacterium]
MKYSYIFLCLLFFIWGCNSSGSQRGTTLEECPQVAHLQTVNGEQVVVADLNLFSKEVQTIPLSELIEDVRFLKLDDRPEALVEAGLTFVTENYIGLGKIQFPQRMPYKLFDRQGNYLSTIGSIGQGPGEYTNMYADYIDEKNERVYILPWSAKFLLAYDFQGKPCDPIPLAYTVPKGVIQVDGDKQRVYVGIIPFENYDSDAVYWVQDFQGNVIHEVEAGHFYVYPDFSNEIKSQRNTADKSLYILYWESRQDSLYHYDELQQKLKPVFTIDFKGDIPMHDYGELPGYFLANITTDFKQVEWGTQAELPAYELLVDKKTLKGTFYRIVNDYLGNIPLEYSMFYFKNGYFTLNMEPAHLKQQLEDFLESNFKIKDEDREYLTKLCNSISEEDDNNYMMIGKLKSGSSTLNFLTETKKEDILQSTVSLPKEEVVVSLTEDDLIHDEDTTIYKIAFYSPYLTEWKTYFPANNRFKDWPKDDEKMVLIYCVAEKSGKATQIIVKRSSGVPELDTEAVRLIAEAPIDPATDKEGNKVRCNFTIGVYFPPR